jgi:hypothetical protein
LHAETAIIEEREFYLQIPPTPSLQDGRGVYALPVVETTGYITLSLRDREKVKGSVKNNLGI